MFETYRRLVELLGLLCIKSLLITCSEWEKCSNRFEFQDDIKIAVPHLTNCTKVGLLYPICAKPILTYYSAHPPYVVAMNGSNPVGLLPDILEVAIKVCCHGCTPIKYAGPYDELQKFKKSSATLYMPLQSASTSTTFSGNDFIPFIKLTGVSVLAKEMTKQAKAHENTQHMMSSVLGTWPLFVTAILMAMISGCVMWLLDTWFNEDEFPHRFPRGPFEGFWWAFVSMTTVGFGDRVPKSFVARSFAIVWIFLGITVFSMYTAILTTALNIENSVFDHSNFINRSVGVLSFTAAGESAILEEHGTPVKFSTISDLAEALRDDRVDAIALDETLARYHMEHFKEKVKRIRLHHRVTGLRHAYGFLSYSREHADFFRSFFETNEDQRHALISRVMYKRWPHLRHEEDPLTNTPSLFSSESPVFSAAILGLCIIGICATFLGITCKYAFKRNNQLLDTYIRCMEGRHSDDPQERISSENQATITKFFNELEGFTTRWKVRVEKEISASQKNTFDENAVKTPKHVEKLLANGNVIFIKEPEENRSVNFVTSADNKAIRY